MADKTRKFKVIIIVFLLFSFISSLGFTFACFISEGNEDESGEMSLMSIPFLLLLISCSSLGFFFTGILPVDLFIII